MFYFYFGNEGKMNVLWVVSRLLLVVKNIPTFSIDKFIAFAFVMGKNDVKKFVVLSMPEKEKKLKKLFDKLFIAKSMN